MDMIRSSLKQSMNVLNGDFLQIHKLHYQLLPSTTTINKPETHKKEEVNLGKLYETHLKSDFLNKSKEFLIHEREIKSVFFTFQLED
jgi:hypothetical protein